MIRVGALVDISQEAVQAVRRHIASGIDTISLYVWEAYEGENLTARIGELSGLIAEGGLGLSSLSIYGNPLGEGEKAESIRRIWTELVETAPLMSCDLVSGFAGRVPGKSVEESLEAWEAFFLPLLDRAALRGVRIAFENCRLGDTWKHGRWNIAINPDAWEILFEAAKAPHLGLEWEPCHQVESLLDPIAQLEAWAPRVFHVHGKDAKIDRAALERHGLYARKPWHSSVLPGEGDTDWTQVFRVLEAASYRGSIDLEYPAQKSDSPSSRTERETRSLVYLKDSRAKASKNFQK